jgi:hypothetical protein
MKIRKKNIVKMLSICLALVLAAGSILTVSAGAEKNPEAAENGPVIYLDMENGNDAHDGLTSETPVRTLDAVRKHMDKADGEGTDTEVPESGSQDNPETEWKVILCGDTVLTEEQAADLKEEGIAVFTASEYEEYLESLENAGVPSPVPTPEPDNGKDEVTPTPGAEEEATPTPGAEEEATPTPTPGAEEEATPTPTPGAEEEATPTPTPGAEEEATPTPTPGAEEEATPTPGAEEEATPTPTPGAEEEATPTPTPGAEEEATLTPTPGAEEEETPEPTPETETEIPADSETETGTEMKGWNKIPMVSFFALTDTLAVEEEAAEEEDPVPAEEPETEETADLSGENPLLSAGETVRKAETLIARKLPGTDLVGGGTSTAGPSEPKPSENTGSGGKENAGSGSSAGSSGQNAAGETTSASGDRHSGTGTSLSLTPQRPKPVQTGDLTQMFPSVISLCLSGFLCLLLARTAVERKRNISRAISQEEREQFRRDCRIDR